MASEIWSTSNWKYINCRKFQAQRKSDFMARTVEDAKNAGYSQSEIGMNGPL